MTPPYMLILMAYVSFFRMTPPYMLIMMAYVSFFRMTPPYVDSGGVCLIFSD